MVNNLKVPKYLMERLISIKYNGDGDTFFDVIQWFYDVHKIRIVIEHHHKWIGKIIYLSEVVIEQEYPSDQEINCFIDIISIMFLLT